MCSSWHVTDVFYWHTILHENLSPLRNATAVPNTNINKKKVSRAAKCDHVGGHTQGPDPRAPWTCFTTICTGRRWGCLPTLMMILLSRGSGDDYSPFQQHPLKLQHRSSLNSIQDIADAVDKRRHDGGEGEGNPARYEHPLRVSDNTLSCAYAIRAKDRQKQVGGCGHFPVTTFSSFTCLLNSM